MIASVLKALDILELFSSSGPTLSLGDIAQRSGYPKSTTHNLLSTLASRGYIERTEDGRYALGTAIMPLTQAVRVNVELRDRAAPLLRELANISRESVYLTVPDGDRALYIYAIESPQRLLARTAVGDRACLHCTAVGKAILAQMPDDRVRLVAERNGLPRFTANTLSDLDSLIADLAETRTRGYSVDNQEHENGVYCVGAPIVGARNQALGACSVSGDSKSTVVSFAESVVRTAQEISRRMGYVPQRPSALVRPGCPMPERGDDGYRS